MYMSHPVYAAPGKFILSKVGHMRKRVFNKMKEITIKMIPSNSPTLAKDEY